MRTMAWLGAVAAAVAAAACWADVPAVIPKPAELKAGSGKFTLTASTKIAADAALANEASFLADLLGAPLGATLKTVAAGKGDITLAIDSSVAGGPEAYTMEVTPAAVTIRGASAAGVFRGIQTLRQLLPAQIESRAKVEGVAWTVPCVTVKDAPRFGWRGLMLDVSRHFFTKAEVEKLLDAMALQKMSVFHWHLVDDNGWRIEIKKYPKLTEAGAWRGGIDFGLDPKASTAYGPDGRYGGFFTQDDIREIVSYAARRHITIVPEIEIPGHSGAVVGAYPQLGCKPGSNVYCAGNEETFTFLEDVLKEIFALFPSKYVHVGGDEVNKGFWKACPKCQARMQSEHLANEHELQSYIIRRVEKFLNANGKSLVGWSEIREGGLSQNATVMDWIGGAVESASAGHDVVMSPTSHCYLDYYQGKSDEPRAIGGFVPLSRTYGFEPIPGKLEAQFHRHILGAQGNVWTEYIPSMKHVQYMAFPRGSALAEVTWSPAASRDYRDFLSRLPNLLAHLEAMGVNFRRPTAADEPADVVAQWKSGQTKTVLTEMEWDVTSRVKAPGRYEVTFQYTSGTHRLDIDWAAFWVNGTEASRDAHLGITGGHTEKNVYALRVGELPAGAKVVLKANVRSDGGEDSNGEISIRKVQ